MRLKGYPEEEERKIEEYREISMRLKGYPEEDVIKARKLVSSFITAAEEVEEKIEEAAEKGELTELVLMVIWNRLDLARRDVCEL
uniref:Protein PALE CRESSic-like n=1 Tax=Rhizophora mucronata TaxID=61149 RepID=A0A2P2KYC6_RHIMU